MLANVSSRISPSLLTQLASGNCPPHVTGAGDGRKLDGLPLTDRLIGFTAARLARLVYAFCSPIALVDGAPMVCPLESKNCASAQSAAAVVNSLMVTLVE